MVSSPTLIVEVPAGGPVADQLRREPPADEVAVVALAPGAPPPAAGHVVMSVLSPEALVREQAEVRRAVDDAGSGDEPLVVLVEAAEELRDDELAVMLDVARRAPRPVILRIETNA
jgi:hypothetical protein